MSAGRSRPVSLRVPIARLPGGRDLPLPAPATAGAAGLDLMAAVEEDLVVEPGARALVPTGFAVALPAGFEGQVRPRSGLALHHGLLLPNAPGTIDADYRGEVKVLVLNAGREPFVIRRGDRIAQLVVAPVVGPVWDEVPELAPSPRGAGGFGHTGRGSAAPAGAGGGESAKPRGTRRSRRSRG